MLFNIIFKSLNEVCFWKCLKLCNTKNLHCCLIVLSTCTHYPKNTKGFTNFTNSLTMSVFSINLIVLINKLNMQLILFVTAYYSDLSKIYILKTKTKFCFIGKHNLLLGFWYKIQIIISSMFLKLLQAL